MAQPNFFIVLTRGEKTQVDEQDFEWLNQWKWCVSGAGYAVRRSEGGRKNSKIIYMHKVILNAPKGVLGDHINRDKLDNRRENLRLCSKAQNNMNKDKRTDNTSGATGVTWHKAAKKWMAQADFNKKHYTLGLFNDIKEAIKVRDSFIQSRHGDFASLNGSSDGTA